ncbi:MAG TPA: hypothetical protein PKC28_03680 [Bdellovibrionales bacterium]|nr:hypothetical protein [Bdellovibrionales bacterium]
MNNETKIEFYLLQLDRELGALPVSQRAEIITEIKSHIRDASEKDPGRPLEQILADLGTPRAVAERYLAFKGVAPRPVRNRPRRVLKWLAVGTVATFALIFFTGLTAIWYFSPLIKVDGEKGRVVLLGGLIDIDEEIGQVKVGDLVMNDALREGVKVQGEEDLAGKDVRVIKIPFNTAKLEILHALDQKLSWDCKAAGESQPEVAISAGILTLNLDRLNLARCAIRMPTGATAQFRGVNGHMQIESPRDNLDIQLDNGKVEIATDSSRAYDFEVKVKNGLQDFFPRSTAKNAVKVKVNVVNGVVKKE